MEFHNLQLESQVEALFLGDRDLAEIKLTIDHMVDPSVDVSANLKIIEKMSADIEAMVIDAGATTDRDKLAILKRYIYQPGPWNNGKVFSYDLANPFGVKSANLRLSDYLNDRKGNCISMPILFMILGNRMGLKMTLAEAPSHLLVKYTAPDGNQWNLEPTSGGGFMRDSRYRKTMPSITDEALANGIYLKGLSRDEMIAYMGSLFVQYLSEAGRFEDASAVAKRLLDHAPTSVFSKLVWANLFGRIFERDIKGRYTSDAEMPPEIRAYGWELYRTNINAFVEAEALGWRDPIVIPDKRMGPLQ